MMPPSYGGGGGGLVSGLSEIGPVEFTDTLSFVLPVPNAARSDTAKSKDADPLTSQFSPIIQVARRARRRNNPLFGVTLTLTVFGNQGSYLASNGSAVTDANGVASFPNFYIDKSGGYTIIAKAPEFGTPGATSNLFNITGQ